MLQKYQLANGMNVILLESHKSPVVSVQMWVRTGSADERKTEEGISHFIEHLVFKGTDKYKVGEIASTVEGSGGELNAYTSFDQTVFYVTISKEFKNVAMDVIRGMMGFPTFDPTEINNERDVVIEEIKRGNDSPGRQSSQLLFNTLYNKHPYGIPVIGYEQNVRDYSIKQIKDYFNSRYVPQNMTLLVTGDIDSKVLKNEIKEKFGAFKKYPLRKTVRAAEPKQIVPRIAVKESVFEEAMLNIAWPIPSIYHKDTVALDMLSLILGGGDSSRLARRLRFEEGIVNYVGTHAYTPQNEGFFAVSAGLNAKNLEATLDAIADEISGVIFEPPSWQEMTRARRILESEDFYAMETVDGLSNKVGTFENLFNDPNYFKKYLAQIEKTTPADICEAARKYLRPHLTNITLMIKEKPARAEALIQQWIVDLGFVEESIMRPKIVATPRPKALSKSLAKAPTGGTGKAERIELSNGIVVLVRPSHETPVVSLKAGAFGGLRVEPERITGVSEIMSSTWTSGTTSRSENEINHASENMAAGLRAFAGRNTAGLAMDFLSGTTTEALELYFDVLLNSTFDEKVVEREKALQLENIISKKDNPSQVCIQHFMRLMFGTHPYGRDATGTEQTVKLITADDIRKQVNQMMGTKNLWFSVSGDFKLDKILAKLESHVGKLKPGQNLSQTSPIQWPTADVEHYEKVKKEQSHIVLGYKGLTLSDPDRYTLQVIQSVLAGQGGRLFLELRDKASLAYSVSPLRMEGIEGGYFGAYIGCSPEKGKQAISMMKIEFDKLCQTAIPQEEVDRAIRYLVGRHDIELQRNSSIGSSMLFDEMYGTGFDHAFKVAQILKGVTSQDCQRVAQKIFNEHAICVAVGSISPFK